MHFQSTSKPNFVRICDFLRFLFCLKAENKQSFIFKTIFYQKNRIIFVLKSNNRTFAPIFKEIELNCIKLDKCDEFFILFL